MIDVARLLYNSQGNRLIYSVLIRLHKLCTSENFIFGQFGYLLLRDTCSWITVGNFLVISLIFRSVKNFSQSEIGSLYDFCEIFYMRMTKKICYVLLKQR